MTAKQLKQKYLDFFVKKNHQILPNVPLVPEDVSSSALFISAGMHPLITYLMGEPHPLGKRLTSNQRCLRTGDIEEVGDPHHLTFFEMLGNWSLGDYWKEEAISWSWEFLTKVLGLPGEKISVSCFKGDKDAPKDEQTASIWRKMGVPRKRIYFFGKNENWWGPVEAVGPCGPCSEMFIDMGGRCRLGKTTCNPSCQCGRYFEIWNDVFMQYQKTRDKKFQPLEQKCVDTGMGVERTVTFLQGKNDIFLIKKFSPIIKEVEKISGVKYATSDLKKIQAFRVIADHLKAATFVVADGVVPSNLEQGYVLRRLIRRAVRFGRQLGIRQTFTKKITRTIIDIYQEEYPHLQENAKKNYQELETEEKRFRKTLEKGFKEFKKAAKDGVISGKEAFHLYETYGFPFEITQEMALEKGLKINQKEFKQAQTRHQEKSRASIKRKFAGGLADHSGVVIKLHSATHLLHQALREVLGDHVHQVGSNITPERLRFDFTHPKKLTETEIKQIETKINKQIKANLPVKMKMMSLEGARKKGALALFTQKYGQKVKTFAMGSYSFEVCGGPHVKSTGEIGGVKIFKEKAVGTGRRRVYARLINSESKAVNDK